MFNMVMPVQLVVNMKPGKIIDTHWVFFRILLYLPYLSCGENRGGYFNIDLFLHFMHISFSVYS